MMAKAPVLIRPLSWPVGNTISESALMICSPFIMPDRVATRGAKRAAATACLSVIAWLGCKDRGARVRE
jgi:hypothetical protein